MVEGQEAVVIEMKTDPIVSMPIDRVIVEGPDCSGKTTLRSRVHDETGYRWNINDRSALSMLVMAERHGRDVDRWRSSLDRELSCLNNFVVCMRTSVGTLLSRYDLRGDDCQTRDGIRILHGMFEREFDRIRGRSNVVGVDRKDNCSTVVDVLEKYERRQISSIARDIQQTVESTASHEVSPLTVRFAVSRDDARGLRWTLDDPDEGEYYKELTDKMSKRVRDEISGSTSLFGTNQNPLTTRRLIVADERCISAVHVVLRDTFCRSFVFLRSSNVRTSLHTDTLFCCYLSALALDEAGVDSLTAPEIEMNFQFNSAHVLETT